MKMDPIDSIGPINRERWNALARANVQWSRPFLDFTRDQAAAYVYRHAILHDVAGKRVLCLASGGGQDSVAFGLLGAEVTVLDLSDEQLARDRQAAAHHGICVTALQGDMRDLSAFAAQSFDIVWQVYSLNFVPDVAPVFHGVARVLKPGGVYFVQFANPFTHSVDEEAWDGSAYPLKDEYREGEDLSQRFPHWDVDQPDGSSVQVPSPHEFRHTLSTVLNTLVSSGFVLLGLWERVESAENPIPGTWAHFARVAPPWFSSFWQLGSA
jgi:SAM-dependent methyltransferase